MSWTRRSNRYRFVFFLFAYDVRMRMSDLYLSIISGEYTLRISKRERQGLSVIFSKLLWNESIISAYKCSLKHSFFSPIHLSVRYILFIQGNMNQY